MKPVINHRIESLRIQWDQGFTMVELLVAMGVGLFLTAGVISLFIGTKQTYSTNEGVAEVQEQGRFVLEELSQETRQSGSLGCQRTLMLQKELPPPDESGRLMDHRLMIRNTLALVDPANSDPNTTEEALNWWLYNFNEQAPLEGFEGSGGSFTASETPSFFSDVASLFSALSMTTANKSQDVIVTRRVQGPPIPILQHLTSSSSLVVLGGSISLEEGDIAIAAACDHATIFQITEIVDDSPCDGLKTINFEALASSDPEFVEPGNQDYGLSGNVSLGWRYANDIDIAALCPVPTSNTEMKTLLNSAIGSLFPLRVAVYYIRTNDDGIPTLWLKINKQPSQQLVNNVHGMQLLYGRNRLAASCGGTDAPDLTNYLSADQVSNWNEINAVKLSLVLGSSPDTGAKVETPVHLPFRTASDGSGDFDATSLSGSDPQGYYQVFNSTIFLRNKIPCLGINQWTRPLGSEL